LWYRFISDNVEDIFSIELNSVLFAPDQSILAAGWGHLEDEENGGLLIKLNPEYSSPKIIGYQPEMLEFSVLIGDSVAFNVDAVDLQEDSILYVWRLDNNQISTDTTVTVDFDELGDFIISCIVFDGALADSISWLVHVEELYIDSYQPDTLDIAVRRNTTVDFSVTSRSVEGEPVDYVWLLDNEEIANGDSLSILFEYGRNHEVEVIAYRGELWDNVIWEVTIMDLIIDYWPRRFELQATIDTVMEFMIEPINPQDRLLNILWTLNGDSIDSRSWTFIEFDSSGFHQVAVHISDSTESDSMTWNINVNPNSIELSDLSLLPDTPTLYPPSPNPFNSSTTVKYSIPTSENVRLDLFDIDGRLVTELIDRPQTAGSYEVVVDGSELVSGVYLVRMTTGNQIQTQKLLLLK
jgi:hypothetical protein